MVLVPVHLKKEPGNIYLLAHDQVRSQRSTSSSSRRESIVLSGRSTTNLYHGSKCQPYCLRECSSVTAYDTYIYIWQPQSLILGTERLFIFPVLVLHCPISDTDLDMTLTQLLSCITQNII